ncbi:MAG: LacI family DNA-binding transcriptional regulator [Herpetosiphonaceae bacterium]|nr:LacI family DNA-binding transcriptional regulator [Herpetosiphonaceae bacterium]
MPVTLQELAEAAGVSVATVSRALSKSSHRVKDATQQRIMALAQERGYRPNLMARGLRTEQSFTIGMIVDNIISPFTPTIIRGIQDHLAEHHYFSIITNGDSDPDVENEVMHRLISRSIDGIIFVEPWMRGRSPVLDVEHKPYVVVHRLLGGTARHMVMVDDQYGAHIAVEHLLNLGHRTIGFINGPRGWESAVNRLIGYRFGLAEHGIAYAPALVRDGDWELESGYAATVALMLLPERPTAIFAANDLMALGAIYAAQDAGLQVPRDLAVVGYDDRELARLSRPTITTVTLPCYEMGRAAATMLLQLLGPGAAEDAAMAIQGTLIVRQSSGAPEGHRRLVS